MLYLYCFLCIHSPSPHFLHPDGFKNMAYYDLDKTRFRKAMLLHVLSATSESARLQPTLPNFYRVCGLVEAHL